MGYDQVRDKVWEVTYLNGRAFVLVPIGRALGRARASGQDRDFELVSGQSVQHVLEHSFGSRCKSGKPAVDHGQNLDLVPVRDAVRFWPWTWVDYFRTLE